MRRKAQDRHLAGRAKSLVKKWRELLLPPTQNKTPPIPTAGEPPPGGGHGGMNGGSKPLVNGNGAAVNQSSYNRPSSRLTSPAANAIQGHHPNNKSTLSPGLRTGVSSSLPSSTSTSPGLSRPTTPINKNSPPANCSHPASPTSLPVHQQPGLYGGESVPRHNAANKRLRKDMEHEDGNHDPKVSLFDVTDGRVDNGSGSGSRHTSPPAKRRRPNGVVSNSTINQNTSEFLLQHSSKEHTAHIANSNSLSSPPLLQNCDNHSAKAAAAIIPPTNRFTSGNIVPPLDASQTPTPSVSPQGSSLSPPAVNAAVMDSNSSAKPPPGRRKTRSQRRSEDEPRDDVLKQQMQSATRSGVLSKVRTTQELVEELTHSRLSSPSLPSTKPSQIINVTDVTQLNETKTELMNRFFDSQNHSANSTNATTDTVLSPPDSEEAGSPSPDVLMNNHSHRSSSSLSRSDSATPIERGVGGLTNSFMDNASKETVEDVMARLPPINTAAILEEIELQAQREAEQEDQEDQDVEGLIPIKKPDVEVTDEMVTLLNDGHLESFNGNVGHDGEFKEWHEVVSKQSADGDLLHILPYSVIE